MEEFFQYIGPDGGAASSAALLSHERLYVHSSPRENEIDRCGELRVGSYFACSAVLYYADQCWLKIRRGYFSNAKNNGYIRVYFDFPTGGGGSPHSYGDLPPRQQCSETAKQPAQFRYLRRLPDFPTFMCARDRLELSREPVFNLHSASLSSSSASSATPRHLQRFLPPVSVFRATECRFNADFTQLAVKVTSALAGLGGWVNASFHKSLVEVEDPKTLDVFRNGPLYMQNVAARGGKWAGELPVRAIPSLQAPRLYNVESFRVVRAVERKLLKDRVWVRIEPLKSAQELEEDGEQKGEAPETNEGQKDTDSGDQEQDTKGGAPVGVSPDAWVIERNANTAQRVVVPWGSSRIQDVPVEDEAERYYRTVYSRRPLPLRRDADLQSDIVGHLQPGMVFPSTLRVLNARGRMWIRVALPSKTEKKEASEEGAGDALDNNEDEEKESEDKGKDEPVQYGYAIQSNAKTNTCMVCEIPPPGKMDPKQFFQVVLSTDDDKASSNQEEVDSNSAPAGTIAARAEASGTAKEIFYVKNGTIVTAIGTAFNAEQGRMWLQVLAAELDASMRMKQKLWTLTEAEKALNVVYLPMCDSAQRPNETVLKPLHRELAKIADPRQAEKDGTRSPSRVVFSGRASKLFGSHLLRPSTIDLPSPFQKKTPGAGVATAGTPRANSAARAAGEDDPAQSLRDEIASWQMQTSSRATQLYTQLGWATGYAVSCLRRPFASCLAQRDARRRYRHLDQDEEGMEDYELIDDDERGELRV